MQSLTIPNVREWVRRWGPALLMMGLIFFASSIQDQEFPDLGLLDGLISKGGHLTGYALLGAALLRGLRAGQPATPRQRVLAVFLAGLYAATDEYHQSFVPGRSASVVDVGIDTLGAVLGVWLAAWRAGKSRT